MITRIGLILALAVVAGHGPTAQQLAVDEFFERFTAEWIRGNPNLAIATRYFSGPEQDVLERQLTPLTPEWQRERVRLAERGLTELRGFDRARMTDSQRVSAALMEWQLETIAAGAPFQDYVYPLEPFAGANVNLVGDLTVSHPLQTEKDASDYLARLAAVGTRMGEAVTEAKRIAAAGVILPRFILTATITQMQQFIAVAPAQNPFVTTLGERLRTMQGVSDARRAELRAEAERIVVAQVYPAWRSAIRLLEEQQPLSTDEAGLSRLKNGAAAYAYQLRRFTTTNLSVRPRRRRTVSTSFSKAR